MDDAGAGILLALASADGPSLMGAYDAFNQGVADAVVAYSASGDSAVDAMMTANGTARTGFYQAVEAAQSAMNDTLSADTTPHDLAENQAALQYAIAEAANSQTDEIAAADSGLMKADAAATVGLKTAYAQSSKVSAMASAGGLQIIPA